MLEEQMISFGGIGILSAVLLYLLIQMQKKESKRDEEHMKMIESVSRVVANNTIAINEIRGIIQKCRR